MEKQKELLLNGKLTKVMWQMAWPAILAMVLYGLNNFLDGIFVGHLISKNALAAVGLAFPLAQIAQGFGSLIGTGLGTAISIWIGAGEGGKLKKALGTANALTLICSALVIIPAYIFAEELIYMMGGRDDIAPIAVTYFKVTILGTFFWIHGLAMNMMIRAEGKMKTAAWMIAIGLVVDVILKPIFIDTFGWGVAGAAWATNASMVIYTLLGMWYYTKGKASFKTHFWRFNLDQTIVKQTIQLGLPAFIMMVMMVIQNVVVFNALANYGKGDDLTFYAAVIRFFILLNTPLWGLMRALQPVAGMNYGAGNYKRVMDSYWLFSLTGLAILLPFWLFVMIKPTFVLSLMIPNELFTLGQLNDFRIFMSVLLNMPFVYMAMVWLPSIEQPKPATILSLLRQTVFYVPVMLIIPGIYGVRSIYWASATIDWVIFILGIFVLLMAMRRLKNKQLNALNYKK